jgi:putative transposase
LAGVEGRRSARAALDLGIEALYTLHTGERQTGSSVLARAHRKVKAEQKALCRKQRGSRRRSKQRDRLARAQSKLARVRRDHLHKLTHDLAQQYHTIAVEDLTITAMVRSARGTIDQPGLCVRQKAGLNRSIHNQAWGEFLSLLGYKLGGGLVKVDPRGTSQECSGCGVKVPKPLRERWHQCPACGLSLHRDQNAAINIYQRAWAAPVAEAA